MRARIYPLLLLTLLGCRGDAAPSAEPPPAEDDAAVPVAAPAETWVELEVLTAPHFATGTAGHAAQLFAAGQWQDARDGFARWLETETASELDTARARFLIAWCDARLRRWPDAADGFAAAAAHLPPLADLARYEAARAYLAADDYPNAVKLARQVAPDSEHAADARLIIGDALYQQEQWSGVADHYEQYLADHPDERDAEARYRLARALERTGRAVPDAVAQYRRITVTDARTAWGKGAKKRIKALLKQVPRREARVHRALATGDYVERGMAQYRQRRHRKAVKEFERALKAKSTTPRDTCVASYYLADSWFRHRDRTRAAPLFDAAVDACETAAVVDYQVKAAYQGGRTHAILGDWAASSERFARAETIAAAHGHTFADDARVFQAEAATMLGDDATSRALLAEVPTLYPDSDMRSEARWRLAWLAYQDRDYAGALPHLKQQLARPPRDPDRKAHSRAQYWLGRVHARLGDADAAAAAYATTARDYPLTYYALLALNRLREEHPKTYEDVLAEIRAAPSEPAPVRLRPRLIANDEDGLRVFELFRLGLESRAEAALFRRGRGRPDAHETSEHAEAMWAAALLHHRAGRHDNAVWVTRWHAVDYKRSWPDQDTRAKWDIAYPRAYVELIEPLAAEYGYPAALQLAIVREESGFNPNIESRSNAVGLSQLIKSTARRFGKKIGVRATSRNLRKPDKNLAIGGRFIAFLWTKWGARAALVPPSYNAGEGAVSRWMSRSSTLPMDEWVEAIPGDQARGYTRRVLGSYFTYAYLTDGSVPTIPNDPVGLP